MNGDKNCCRLDASLVLAASLEWEGARVWVLLNLFFLLSKKKKVWLGWGSDSVVDRLRSPPEALASVFPAQKKERKASRAVCWSL